MKKVVIGLSGGVDSAVAAYLLSKEYEVIGVTLRMQGDCFAFREEEDAAKAAARIGIPHEIVDCTEAFTDVQRYFADAYLAGTTPNPCIFCNPTVKWKMLLDYADRVGAEYVATGHYAFVEQTESGRYTLRTADSDKDQTYALCMLSQEQLARTIMPLGRYSKEEVRAFAREIGLEISDKPDSMEICFVRDNDYAGFIERYQEDRAVSAETEGDGTDCKSRSTDADSSEADGKSRPREGNFVDMEGHVLGRHKGFFHYTIGQRKGLGIAFGKPMFVKEILPETNEVVLAGNEDLFVNEVAVKQFNRMGADDAFQAYENTAAKCGEKVFLGKIRYSHKGEKCSIISADADSLRIRFENPVRAVTPGQALVLYDVRGRVIGGGIIQKDR